MPVFQIKSGLRIKKADLWCLEANVPIVHPLPKVAGSAADMATFFLLNGVVGDGPRTHFTQSRAPGGMTTILLRKKANLK